MTSLRDFECMTGKPSLTGLPKELPTTHHWPDSEKDLAKCDQFHASARPDRSRAVAIRTSPAECGIEDLRETCPIWDL